MAQMGYSAAAATEELNWYSYIMFMEVTPTESGNASTGTFYVWMSSDQTLDLQCGVYASSGGSPSSQALLSDDIGIAGIAGTQQLINGELTWTGITASTKYHFAVNHPSAGGAGLWYDTVGSLDSHYLANAASGGLPTTAGTATANYSDRSYGVYLDYTASAVPIYRRRHSGFG